MPWQIVPSAASLDKADGKQDEVPHPPQSDDDLLCIGDMLAHQDPANQMSQAQLELQRRAICKLNAGKWWLCHSLLGLLPGSSQSTEHSS